MFESSEERKAMEENEKGKYTVDEIRERQHQNQLSLIRLQGIVRELAEILQAHIKQEEHFCFFVPVTSLDVKPVRWQCLHCGKEKVE